MNEQEEIIAIDFDGVINSYLSGWQGAADIISDPPVEGALEFIDTLVKSEFKVCIFSTRNHQNNAINAMQQWLQKYFTIYYGNIEQAMQTILAIDFPLNKPPAYMFIDDKAFPFKGKFPSLDNIRRFKSWVEK